MAQPKLSICIPTRNRAALLERTIRFLLLEAEFPFAIEVCVSDNASIDETPQVVASFIDQGLPVRYRRNEIGVPMWTNYSNVMRHGRGEYLVALSDDDLLIIPQVVKVIQTLDQDPNVVAAYAPFEYFDDVQQVGGRYSYDLNRFPESTRLSIRNPVETANFFLQQVVPPELLIYRAEVVATLFSETRFCYTNLFDMSGLLLQGDVIFFREAFYRWVTESSAQSPPRAHAGTFEGAAGWNSWRGGIEELIQTLFERGGITLDTSGKAALKGALDQFELRRMSVTLGVALNTREFLTAFEIYSRIRAFCGQAGLDPLALPAFVVARDTLRDAMPSAYLTHVVRQEQHCNQILMVDLRDPEKLGQQLRGQLVEQNMLAIRAGGIVPPLETVPDHVTRLVVVETRAQKRNWIAAGYTPGQVFDLESLSTRFPL